jgi:hypothetical protein
MKRIAKFATSLVAISAINAIAFAGTISDSEKPAGSAAIVIPGAKLDSGLGNLPADYTGAEFQKASYIVAGGKQDSGLGDLPSDYTGAEFMRSGIHFASATQDMGVAKMLSITRSR